MIHKWRSALAVLGMAIESGRLSNTEAMRPEERELVAAFRGRSRYWRGLVRTSGRVLVALGSIAALLFAGPAAMQTMFS